MPLFVAERRLCKECAGLYQIPINEIPGIIFGLIIYFFIKILLAYFVGIVALPVGIVKLIINIVSANKKEKNINQNLQNN